MHRKAHCHCTPHLLLFVHCLDYLAGLFLIRVRLFVCLVVRRLRQGTVLYRALTRAAQRLRSADRTVRCVRSRHRPVSQHYTRQSVRFV